MKYFAKIGGVEHELLFASVWPAGSRNMNSPAVVTMTAEMDIVAAKELFKNPGEWSLIERPNVRKYADGTVIQGQDMITDCTEYEVLSEITDSMDGTVKIVMRKTAAEELLRILAGNQKEGVV